MKDRSSARNTGFTLPITLLVISAITFLVVALLVLVSSDSKTSKNYLQIAQTELALESALSIALASLSEIAKRDDSLVFRIDDPHEPEPQNPDRPLGYQEKYFTFGALHKDRIWNAIPLFSGMSEILLDSYEIDGQILQDQLSEFIKTSIVLNDTEQSIPQAQWVNFPTQNKSGEKVRYAYWIEDLSGRLPGKVANTQQRKDGKTSAEIAYQTIVFPENEESIPLLSSIHIPNTLPTSGSLRSFFPDQPDLAKRLEPYIHFYEAISSPPRIIPYGFDYADAGKAAPSLNFMIQNRDIVGIAEQIHRQIPDFVDRKGGFPGDEDYLKTLAASIIDYADNDSDATTGIGYRGIDSYPFINEIFDRYEWLLTSPTGKIHLKAETYIELWNLSQQSIQGEIEFTNDNQQKIKLIKNNTSNYQGSLTPVTFPKKTISIPSNGFLVLKIGEHTYEYPNDDQNNRIQFIESNSLENNYQLKWNGQIVDKARGGIHRTGSFIHLAPNARVNPREWKGNASPEVNWDKSQFGDPRMSWYLRTPISSSNYEENSSWGGRALKRKIYSDNPASTYAEVRLEKWPDRGSNTIAGVKANTQTNRPSDQFIVDSLLRRKTGSEYQYPDHEPDLAPSFISNLGFLESLGELGNIFDPAQWQKVEQIGSIASSTSGGGMTLAIGRPEYSAFDRDSWRSAQLLDIFSLNKEQQNPYPININTASREVLRSMIAGVILDQDPIAPHVAPKKINEIGDIFADFVISHRNIRPFRANSDLNQIRINPEIARDPDNPDDAPYFGNIDYFENAPVITDRDGIQHEWDDAGREELFKKVIDLISFHSKLFRIVVFTETSHSNGEILSRGAKEYHYRLDPSREINGNIRANEPLTFTKLFERDL